MVLLSANYKYKFTANSRPCFRLCHISCSTHASTFCCFCYILIVHAVVTVSWVQLPVCDVRSPLSQLYLYRPPLHPRPVNCQWSRWAAMHMYSYPVIPETWGISNIIQFQNHSLSKLKVSFSRPLYKLFDHHWWAITPLTPSHSHPHTLTGHYRDPPSPRVWYPSSYPPQPQASHECGRVWTKMDKNELSVSVYTHLTPTHPDTPYTGVSMSYPWIMCHFPRS